jgi:hypothetical protein
MFTGTEMTVSKIVLGALVTYNPQHILKTLEKKRRFHSIHERFVGQRNATHQVWCAITAEVYRECGTPISPTEAEGILSLFLTGHSTSIQLLSAGSIIALDPSS